MPMEPESGDQGAWEPRQSDTGVTRFVDLYKISEMPVWPTPKFEMNLNSRTSMRSLGNTG